MSKQTKRKITVEVASKTSEQPKSRPSVFERLGTKTTTTSSQSSEYCRHWSQNGTCPYGKSCKYASTHTLTSPSKRAAKKDEQIQKKQNQNQNRTTATSKDDPTNKRLHSTIVKALRSPEPEWEQWNQTDLEDADAEMLEKRRQELQRELELQMKMESKLTKTKEKTSVKKGSSSSSSNSSSSSTESSSSSEETSSTSSSTSLDSRSRKAKRTKPKRDSSSSTEPERRKKKTTSKSGHKHASSSTSNIKTTEKKKTASPALKSSTTTKSSAKSPSPSRVSHRLSQTPPLKSNKPPLAKSTNKTSSRSPRSQSQSQSQSHSQTPVERKDKHRTPSPSPKLSSSASARDRDRDRERERERIKEKERARDKEREKVRDKDKTREKEKSREREKVRERERERERERDREQHNNNAAKSNNSRSPKRATSRQARDPQKKKEPSIEARGKVVDIQKSRSTNSSKRDSNTNTNTNASKNSPGVAASSKDTKEDRRLERNRDEDKKKDDRERRDRERDRDRDRDRDVKDRSLERRKDKDKDKDKEKEKQRDVRDRERERERRLTREEREAAREKEREEALARCQERQRERERLKELAKKERENIPSLLHINTCAAPPGATNVGAGRLRDRDRDRERERERDRGLDKPPADRVERLLPLPADRIPPMRKELERQAARSQDRNRSTNRGGGTREREPERAPPFDYREGRDRDFSSLGARGVARDERRHEDSPYRRDERPPYLELEHEHYENPRDREYPEERRGSGRRDRDAWDIEPVDMVMDEERRRVYGRERGERERERDREETRPPSTLKERTWDNPEYVNRAEWERNRRAAHDWPEDWDQTDHNSMEAEWRHYNRSMDSWPSDERRRWPQDFPERRSGPTSTSSHRGDADEHLDVPLVPVVEELKKDTILGKRIAEPSAEDIPEVKKPCVVPIEDSTILEDALSEISDDADEILNREDEPALEQCKDAQAEEVSGANTTAITATSMDKELEKESEEVKVESPAQVQVQVQMQMNTTNTNNNNHHHHEQDNEEETIDEDGIDNMDFEEISDEELEEEVKVKGLGDALGVDWASLVAECRPRTKFADKAGSAKKRWEYSSVLSRIGVSLQMAGQEIAQDIRGSSSPPITIEVAAIQVAKHEATLVRSNLFASAGPYRRALSARRDLAIRRHLCNLPITDNVLDRPTYTAPDPQFYKTVLETIAIK